MTLAIGGVSAAEIELDQCRLEGVSVPALCGALTVFEDRDARTGRTIDLNVVVIPAKARNHEPDPIFFLAGGPGQAASQLGGLILARFAKLRDRRDIVLVDQRGTGDSNGLECELDDSDDLARSLSADLLSGQALAKCREQFNADLTKYTTPIAMDDLDDVRAALGYEKINLFGISYGTRAGLVFMRRHPDRVRAAVLDGMAPVAMRLPISMGRDAERAMDMLFRDCAADPSCAEAYGDLAARFEALIERLSQAPPTTTVKHPRSGELQSLEISAEVLGAILRNVLYDPMMASLIPLVIDRALADDFEPLLAMAVSPAAGGMAVGMLFSVICAEDVPMITSGELEQGLNGSILGRASIRSMTDACVDWPRGDLPAGFFEPVKTDHPILVLSGELDPVTPPSWGESVLAELSDARHVIVPGTGHGVSFRGCMSDVVHDFIADPHAELDTSCARSIDRPPFFVTPAGTDP